MLDPARPGDSNQALMELGATLCLPRRPQCLLCPLRPGCRAARSGEPERYPVPRAKRSIERHRLLVAVAENGEGVLLFRRPDDSGLLAGTWELPWAALERDGAPAEARPEEALAARYGGQWRLGPLTATVRHGITHRDLQVEVHRAELVWEGGARPGLAAGWFGAAGRAALPLSSLVGKALAALGPTHRSPGARRSRRPEGRSGENR